jgi:hypothetical protein
VVDYSVGVIPIKYFPFSVDDDRPQLGLKALDFDQWIEVDANWSRDIELKKEILRDHRATVFHVSPAANDYVFELHETLREHLLKQNAQKFSFLKNVAQPTSAEQALEELSLWTQEDWALLSADAPVLLDAGCICFPSRWSPAEKFGKGSEGIHGPVPKFQTIARPTQNFLERVVIDKPVWRLNWTIHDSNQLFSPKPHPSRSGWTAENVLARTWLRVERQTLRRLSRTRAVVFSIRTYVHPMSEVVKDPAHVQHMKDSFAVLNPETANYKGMSSFFEPLKAALG